jgi:hypothetical protein
MSNQALTAIRFAELKPSGKKFVAMALADFADENWECFPEVDALAEYTAQGERTVREHLDALEAEGFLSRTRHRRKDGTLCGYRYKILWRKQLNGSEHPAAEIASGNDQRRKPTSGEIPPVAKNSTNHRRKTALTTGEIRRSLNPQEDITPIEEPPTVRAMRAVTRFAEFWEAYPHRDGQKRGRKKSVDSYAKAVKHGVSEQAIIDGAKQAHFDPTVVRGFAKDPTTWLNAEGWADEINPSGTVHQFPRKNGQGYGERLDEAYEAAGDLLAKHPFPS